MGNQSRSGVSGSLGCLVRVLDSDFRCMGYWQWSCPTGGNCWSDCRSTSDRENLGAYEEEGWEWKKVRVRNGITEKLCSTCRAWKPLTGFSPGGKSHDRPSEAGKHRECRTCNAARHRERYAGTKTLKRRLGLSSDPESIRLKRSHFGVLSFSRLVDLIFPRCGLSFGVLREDGDDRWRTHAGLAGIGSLVRGWAVFVALRTEGFVSSSSL